MARNGIWNASTLYNVWFVLKTFELQQKKTHRADDNYSSSHVEGYIIWIEIIEQNT